MKKESIICRGIFDLASKEARVKELETLMEAPTFWDDKEKAQAIINESNQLKVWTVPYDQLKRHFEDVKTLLPDAYEANEQSLIAELLQEP